MLAPAGAFAASPIRIWPAERRGGWTVSAKLMRDGAEIAIGTGQHAATQGGSASGRVVRIDGEPARLRRAGRLYAAALADSRRWTGCSPGRGAERRRFLDRLVASFDGAHRTRLNHFERAMRQRNRLLEMGERSTRLLRRGGKPDGGNRHGDRRRPCRGRGPAGWRDPGGPRRARKAPFPWADLALEGGLEACGARQCGRRDRGRLCRAAAPKAATGTARRAARWTGRIAPICGCGTGRKTCRRHLCSTGEQKALLIGLILAHAQGLKDCHDGLAPLLLLDEIAAHLDVLRREALFAAIETLGAQAWMTGTDEQVFAPLRNAAQFFTVANGSVARNNPDPRRVYALG